MLYILAASPSPYTFSSSPWPTKHTSSLPFCYRSVLHNLFCTDHQSKVPCNSIVMKSSVRVCVRVCVCVITGPVSMLQAWVRRASSSLTSQVYWIMMEYLLVAVVMSYTAQSVYGCATAEGFALRTTHTHTPHTHTHTHHTHTHTTHTHHTHTHPTHHTHPHHTHTHTSIILFF